MRKPLLAVVLVPGILCLTGCPKYKPNLPPVLAEKVIKYELTEFADDIDEYYSAIDDTTPSDIPNATKYRDRVINRLKRAIDGDYHEFENQFFTGRATTNSLLDMTEFGAHAAAIMSHGEHTKTVIDTLLTAFRGGRKSVDENFFKERTTSVITSQMQASRARIETNISKSMLSDASKYTLDAALGDLVNYFYAGTLATALQDLSAQTGQNALAEKGKAQTAVEQLRAGTAQRAAGAISVRVRFNQLFQDALTPPIDLDKQAEAVKIARKALQELTGQPVDPSIRADDLFDQLNDAIGAASNSEDGVKRVRKALQLPD